MYDHETDSSGASPLEQGHSQTYSTTDLNLASFLACRGLTPDRVEPPPPNKFPRFASFTYSRTSAIEEAVQEWSDDSPATVNVHEFVGRRWDLFQWARSVVRGGAR